MFFLLVVLLLLVLLLLDLVRSSCSSCSSSIERERKGERWLELAGAGDSLRRWVLVLGWNVE